MKVFVLIIAVFMAALTIIGCFPSFAAFIFADGSDSVFNFAFPNIWVQLSLVLSFGFLAVVLKAKAHKRAYPVFILLFVIWALTGRTFGIFPEGRVVTGWFYIPTNHFEVCKNAIDCEKTLANETDIESLTLWRIRIKNKGIDKTMFIGPWILSKTLQILDSKCNRHARGT